MGSLNAPLEARLDWGVASHAQVPLHECGDAWTIRGVEGGCVVAVIDGLGHGTHAARASRSAIESISQSTAGTLEQILLGCHHALLRSRGAAISLARIDLAKQELAWLGVGNVDGLVLSPVANQPAGWQMESLVVRGGVVGYELPNLRSSRVPFAVGAVLVFATDGVKQGFSKAIRPGQGAQAAADRLMAEFDLRTDDALILVVRHTRGGPHHDS